MANNTALGRYLRQDWYSWVDNLVWSSIFLFSNFSLVRKEKISSLYFQSIATFSKNNHKVKSLKDNLKIYRVVVVHVSSVIANSR
jgi:hypothetical protein